MENPLEYTVLIGRPAYGRDYATKEALALDWLNGKDFRNVTPGVPGTYFSIRDAGRASDVLLGNRNETIIISTKNIKDL